MHRDLLLDDLLCARGEDRGIDLARRDRIDAHADAAEVRRHLARQRGQCRFRGRVGRAREGMHPRARDRGDVDHRAFGGLQFLDQPARHHDRCEEIDPEHMAPGVDIGIDRAEPFAPCGLRRDGGVVDECVQHAALQPPSYFRNRARGVVVVGEVDLDVILRAGVPRAVFGKGMPRAGDDAPAGRGEADHGGVPDAAAGPGQKQRAPRRIGGRRHKRFSRSPSWPGSSRPSTSFSAK